MWTEQDFQKKFNEMVADYETWLGDYYNAYSWWDGYWYAIFHSDWISSDQYNKATNKNWELYQNTSVISYPVD